MSIKRIFAYGVVCIAAQASLVELAVTVRDSRDQAIAGLRREDFELFDRGERQVISVFDAHTSAPSAAPGAPAPRTIALFFDDTHGAAPDLQNARNAAARFLDSSLHPDDLVGIFTTSGAEIVDFTSDRRVLAGSLARLHLHSAGGARPAPPAPRSASSNPT